MASAGQCVGGARNQSRVKIGSDPILRTGPRLSSVQAHRPTAAKPKTVREGGGEENRGTADRPRIRTRRRFEEIEEGGIHGTTQEIQIGDFKVAPGCVT